MKLGSNLIHELRVEPGHPAALNRRSTQATSTDWLGALGHTDPRDVADRDLETFKQHLAKAQGLLYASDTRSLLIIFQALDAAGKDGTISHVMSGVDPQGCQVTSFKEPTDRELRHTFLWRCSNALPERGRIGIFNRSYYEDVLVVRVHPELLHRSHLPAGAKVGPGLWQQRFEDINAFERHLTRNGTAILKLFLHVSKDEQRRRLLARLDDPSKQWKFSPSDVTEHSLFDQYRKVYEETLAATSTAWAPWYVVPADHKHAMRALVAGLVVASIDKMGLKLPVAAAGQLAGLEAARNQLAREPGSKPRPRAANRQPAGR